MADQRAHIDEDLDEAVCVAEAALKVVKERKVRAEEAEEKQRAEEAEEKREKINFVFQMTLLDL
jgi:hypothetical protein